MSTSKQQFMSTIKKTLVPQTFSGIGMTAAATGGTIDTLGPIPYAVSLALGIFNIVSPAKVEEKNPILRTLRKPETASHLMMSGAAINVVHYVGQAASNLNSPDPQAIALATYWSLAGLAHYKMGELQSQNNNAQAKPTKNTLEAISKNPGNIFIPMNLILASLPFMMNGSLPTAATSFISLACTIAAGHHVFKKTGQNLRGEIKPNEVNDGVVNKWNMGVCLTNAFAFASTAVVTHDPSAVAMAVASAAFVGTNWKLMKMFSPKTSQEPK